MKPRINYGKVSGVYDAMEAVDQYVDNSGLDESLLHLIRLRASQINGCAYCLDMHAKDLRALGETEQRIYSLAAWSHCPYYSDRERAALAWTEAITLIAEGHAADAVYGLRPDGRHTRLYESRTGRDERPRYRHPQRHLFARRAAL